MPKLVSTTKSIPQKSIVKAPATPSENVPDNLGPSMKVDLDNLRLLVDHIGKGAPLSKSQISDFSRMFSNAEQKHEMIRLGLTNFLPERLVALHERVKSIESTLFGVRGGASLEERMSDADLLELLKLMYKEANNVFKAFHSLHRITIPSQNAANLQETLVGAPTAKTSQELTDLSVKNRSVVRQVLISLAKAVQGKDENEVIVEAEVSDE